MTAVLWILFYVGLFYLMGRLGLGCCGGHGSHRRHGGHNTDRSDRHGPHETTRPTRTDPVCGMAVTGDTVYSRDFDGHEYRFCSKTCMERFDRNPAEYAVEERIAS